VLGSRTTALTCVLGVVALALSACSGNSGSPAAVSDVSPAGDFADVFGADLAGDARGLSLVVAGQARGPGRKELVVRVYRRSRGSGWERAPRLKEALDSGGAMSVVQSNGTPCVGYQGRGGTPVLACLRGRDWLRLPRAGLPAAGLPAASARLTKLALFNGRLIALFQAGRPAGKHLNIVRLEGNRWRRLGRRIPAHGAIAALGENSAGHTLDLALNDVAAERRSVWHFSEGRWRQSAALEGVGAGPMPSGPVRVGGRVYLPVVDASGQPWRLWVYTLDDEDWSRLGKPLNRGPGNAQGVLRVNGGSVWAGWQEHDPREDGLFDTHMYVQKLAPAPGEAREVWAGTSIGPGNIETVVGAGSQSVLYMPQAQGRRGLTVRVRPFD
jgi:hypothetical protein